MTRIDSRFSGRTVESSGDVEIVAADNGGILNHAGNAEQAHAFDGGRVLVKGLVSVKVLTAGKGVAKCKGNPEVVSASDEGSYVAILGSPGHADAQGGGLVRVFGEPKSLRAYYGGKIEVVSLNPDYEPETLHLHHRGRASITTPKEALGYDFTGYNLDMLFEDGRADPLFIAYAELLQRPSEQKLF